MTPSPSNHDSAPEFTPLTSNKIIDPSINVPPITHQQETQPSQDMDIGDPSYLSVAQKSKDLPVVEKSVTMSFHLLKNFVTKVLPVLTIASTLLTMKLFVKALSPSTIIESV